MSENIGKNRHNRFMLFCDFIAILIPILTNKEKSKNIGKCRKISAPSVEIEMGKYCRNRKISVNISRVCANLNRNISVNIGIISGN